MNQRSVIIALGLFLALTPASFVSHHPARAGLAFAQDIVAPKGGTGAVAASGRQGAPQVQEEGARSLLTDQGEEEVAGYIFGQSVPLENYYFAKRVTYIFPWSGEDRLESADRERVIWEALIFHYESFRRGVTVSDEELEERINAVLKGQQQSFARSGNPEAYAAWVKETVQEPVELFENQMQYLLQIEKLKTEVRDSRIVTVTDQEIQDAFLSTKRHVGGEMVVFETREEAQALYERVNEPSAWDAMKEAGEQDVKPVGLMTLVAYIDLWGVPQDQIEAFHALEIGSIGSPLPFGTKWCVYRLLEKRTADVSELPEDRDRYYRQVKGRKQYEELKQWLEDLKTSAELRVLPVVSEPPG